MEPQCPSESTPPMTHLKDWVMPVKVTIPTPLRPFADLRDAVQAEGSNVGEVLSDLVSRHPQLRQHLYGPDGRLRSFVNVYLNDQDIRYSGAEATPVQPSDTVSIVPSIAGGRC